MRLLHGLLCWLRVPERWARWRVLRVTLKLMWLDYLLFEVVQTLPLPADLEQMRKLVVPETSAVRMASMLESVQGDYLKPAIQELWAVVQTSDAALRREGPLRGSWR